MMANPNDDDDESNDLPVVHETEGKGPVARLKEAMGQLDGPFAVSNCLVPMEANDIGDVDDHANPRAGDLEYAISAQTDVRAMSEREQEFVMYDGDLGATYTIHVDGDTLIEDVSLFN